MSCTIHLLMRAVLLLILLFGSLSARADLVLGVHPFKPASKLISAFTPLADYLSEKMGEPVRLVISKDYSAHIDAVAADEIDVAYMGPSQYVGLRERGEGWPLLARQVINGNPYFHARIFVRTDSPIRDLAGLKGKRFAFGEPHSTMSHLVPRNMLFEAGITVEDFASYKFVGDHVNVALGVLAGDFDAGAVKEDVYFKHAPQGLRDIATSPDIADHVFVASRRLSDEKARQLRDLLLGLDKTPEGPDILETMTHGVTALVPAKDSDYDALSDVMRSLKEKGVEF